jgi:hypothetical protein
MFFGRVAGSKLKIQRLDRTTTTQRINIARSPSAAWEADIHPRLSVANTGDQRITAV